jgi:hypothetical protein
LYNSGAASTYTLSGDNTFTGNVWLGGAGFGSSTVDLTLNINNATALGAGNTINLGGVKVGTFSFNQDTRVQQNIILNNASTALVIDTTGQTHLTFAC